ncbi:MAG: response regulator transcription factor [Patulibacter sp.]|nr:response regulator transcription factor [Patulibacter sp.]
MQRTSTITEQQATVPVLRAPKVLLLEPREEVAKAIADGLTADDMEVCVAATAAQAASRLRSGSPDVAIVRVELAEATGYTVVDRLRELRVLAERCQVIAISENASPIDRVRALSRGCVDFLALPLYYPELHARVQLALSRNAATGAERVEAIEVLGGLRIDPRSMEVHVNGQAVTLSGKEWALLVALVRDPTRVMTKAELLRDVWGFASPGRTRTLDSHACRLRNKLAAVGGDYIHNQWSVGYRLLPVSPL